MAKVFTITEGLENMGAIKTGGQGSVYKGRRIGEIITAIKILPTPIYSESADDKNYIAFQNEVQKLKKVNEDANPNVVKIINSGITESGNFPFIEMEFIEGPDLEELLKPPHDGLFTVKEVLKVADQLSNALAHCHKADVKHGDIKSNNVKYNVNTGNYVLLDFGLAVMSDEQRRTSLRQAGAIEFMAPEQNEGKMLFQTDVYSFGVVLFELLAATVPFPSNDKGETGRNAVMVAHLETPPPDIIYLRQKSLPAEWDEGKKQHEMQVPEWLTALIYKCLKKNPGDRFENGAELHDYIWKNTIRTENNGGLANARITFLEEENKRLRTEKEHLQQQLLQYRHPQITSTQPAYAYQAIADKTIAVQSVKQRRKSSLFLKTIAFTLFAIAAIAVAVFAFLKMDHNTSIPASNSKLASSASSSTESFEYKGQLHNARQFLSEGKLPEAFIIISNLSQKQVPEAMYLYARLALQNKNQNISCADAFDLLKRASDKGYIPAKRTLGFLYSYADNKDALQQASYYQRCSFAKNLSKGTALLMEATLQGDTSASRFLDQLAP